MFLAIDSDCRERDFTDDAVIAGDPPFCGAGDIGSRADADTPCKCLYLALQTMYLDGNPQRLHGEYFGLVREIQNAAPSTTPFIYEINQNIIDGSYDRAFRAARKLIGYEAELLANA